MIKRFSRCLAFAQICISAAMGQSSNVALSTLGNPNSGTVSSFGQTADPIWEPSINMWLSRSVYGSFIQSFTTGAESTGLDAVTIPLSSSGISLSDFKLSLRDSTGTHIAWLVYSDVQTTAGTRYKPESNSTTLNPNSTYSIALDIRSQLPWLGFSVQAAYSQTTTPSQARPGWSMGELLQGITPVMPNPNYHPYSFSGIAGSLLMSIEAKTLLPEISVEYPLGTEITNNASAVAFEGTVVGASTPARTYTIRSVGGAQLTGLALSLRGSNQTDFTIGSLSATNLAAGAVSTFTVTFSPKALGSKYATVEIANNDSDENPYIINLSGQGLSPADIAVFDHLNNEIQNNSSAILFPDTLTCLCTGDIPQTNSSSSKIYTIKNTGQVNLSISSISNTGTNAAEFTFTGTVLA